MPWKLWTNHCCSPNQKDLAPLPCRCGPDRDCRSQWIFSTQEQMAREQMHYGLKRGGPHALMKVNLIRSISRACDACGGAGLLADARTQKVPFCPDCLGWGYHPLPGSPEIKALREQVINEFYDAGVDGADAVTPYTMMKIFGGGGVVIQNLLTGIMEIVEAPGPAPRRRRKRTDA